MLLSRHTRRRDLLAVLGCTTIALRRAATAKGAGRPVRIAVVSGGGRERGPDFFSPPPQGGGAGGHSPAAPPRAFCVLPPYFPPRVLAPVSPPAQRPRPR